MRVWWGNGTTWFQKTSRRVAGQVASGLGNMAIEMGTLKAGGNGFILYIIYIYIYIYILCWFQPWIDKWTNHFFMCLLYMCSISAFGEVWPWTGREFPKFFSQDQAAGVTQAAWLVASSDSNHHFHHGHSWSMIPLLELCLYPLVN